MPLESRRAIMNCSNIMMLPFIYMYSSANSDRASGDDGMFGVNPPPCGCPPILPKLADILAAACCCWISISLFWFCNCFSRKSRRRRTIGSGNCASVSIGISLLNKAAVLKISILSRSSLSRYSLTDEMRGKAIDSGYCQWTSYRSASYSVDK